MTSDKERILVVESDPIVSDLIARQALGSQGFDVKVVGEASAAIQEAMNFSPDVVVANLELPGLGGKDLMAALSYQNVQIPVIMIASKGQEKDVIDAFRLGASDYISAPVREAEVVSAVERALKAVRARKERESLSRQLQRTNQELEKRVNELTTLFAVGKAVTSITDQRELFDNIVENAVKITRADYGWVLILKDSTKEFILRAHRNLPKSLLSNMNKPWDDGISSFVAKSGEAFSIHGQSMERFMLYSMGKSALVAPVKVGKETIALLVVMRKTDKEFDASDQAMLEAVSDYAAISLVNARLFRAIDQRAEALQETVDRSKETEKLKDEIVQNVSHELRTPLVAAKGYVDMFVEGDLGTLNKEQLEALSITQQKLDHMVEIVEAMTMMHEATSPKQLIPINMNDLSENAILRFQDQADKQDIFLVSDLPPDWVYAIGDPDQIALVFDALLTNAFKFSKKGGLVTIRLQKMAENHAQVSIIDEGIGISKRDQKKIFSRFFQIDGSTTREQGGLGIGLALVQEIIDSHGGKVWVESEPDEGAAFHFTLLPPDESRMQP